jgi:hypothetical protein
LDGQPLASGSISFQPTAGGISAGAPIKEGQYAIDQSKGPSPGQHKVAIFSSKPTGREIPTSDGVTRIPEVVEVVPARYNLNTQLRAEVQSAATAELDFNLHSRAAGRRSVGRL